MTIKNFSGTAVFAAVFVVLIITAAVSVRSDMDSKVYFDAGRPIDVRVEDLLGRMTLEEKIGQLNMPYVNSRELGRDIDSKYDGCRQFTAGTLLEGIGPCGGFFALANAILHNGARQQADFFNELQKIAVEKTRLKIPLLQIEEGTHGLMCSGGTIFPEGLAIGSSWNMDLAREMYASAAREARAVGIHDLCTLVVEPNRDPRLGRNQEGYSEDPYLCSRVAESIVRGMQGDDLTAGDTVVASLCHYPGQSQPVSGLERGAMEISDRMLREVFLPPWVTGIKKHGALGVMATYPAIDGVPTHASVKILTDILRGELDFKGIVLCEGGGFETLEYERVAANQKEAGELAIKAGVDVSIWFEPAYLDLMIENVREGKVAIETIDRAVRRVLRLKFQLGLFENPYVDPQHAEQASLTPEHRELALQAAREGIVLLKNDGNLLPLDKTIGSIAVIGPNADHDRNQLGDYVSETILQDIVTVLDGIRNKVSGNTKVTYVKGCEVIGSDLDEISKARSAAKEADIAIVVLGENEWQAPDKQGTSGEAFDSATLELTGLQNELVEAVYETGTPTIVVLINGRPLATRWIVENVPALVEAWCPGEQGGNAVADILFGDYNPSGKLTVTVPRHAGQLPVYYNYKPSKRYWIEDGWGKAYADISALPLYEFGFGLSYTTFEYENLRISPEETGPAGNIQVEVDVRNTGSRAGAEVVQLYINDVLGSVTTPVKELKGFEKVLLNPGEQTTVEFTLTPEHLSLLDRHLERVVEPGTFEVLIGSSSEDIRQEGSFTITD